MAPGQPYGASGRTCYERAGLARAAEGRVARRVATPIVRVARPPGLPATSPGHAGRSTRRTMPPRAADRRPGRYTGEKPHERKSAPELRPGCPIAWASRIVCTVHIVAAGPSVYLQQSPPFNNAASQSACSSPPPARIPRSTSTANLIRVPSKVALISGLLKLSLRH